MKTCICKYLGFRRKISVFIQMSGIVETQTKILLSACVNSFMVTQVHKQKVTGLPCPSFPHLSLPLSLPHWWEGRLITFRGVQLKCHLESPTGYANSLDKPYSASLEAWALILLPPLTSCVIFGNSFNFSRDLASSILEAVGAHGRFGTL